VADDAVGISADVRRRRESLVARAGAAGERALAVARYPLGSFLVNTAGLIVEAVFVSLYSMGYYATRAKAQAASILQFWCHVPLAFVAFCRAPQLQDRRDHERGAAMIRVLLADDDALLRAARTAAVAMAVGSAGYGALVAAILATAYAGRAPYAPTVPMALLLVGGVVALGAVAARESDTTLA
jgi:hypothetical protein